MSFGFALLFPNSIRVGIPERDRSGQFQSDPQPKTGNFVRFRNIIGGRGVSKADEARICLF